MPYDRTCAAAWPTQCRGVTFLEQCCGTVELCYRCDFPLRTSDLANAGPVLSLDGIDPRVDGVLRYCTFCQHLEVQANSLRTT